MVFSHELELTNIVALSVTDSSGGDCGEILVQLRNYAYPDDQVERSQGSGARDPHSVCLVWKD